MMWARHLGHKWQSKHNYTKNTSEHLPDVSASGIITHPCHNLKTSCKYIQHCVIILCIVTSYVSFWGIAEIFLACLRRNVKHHLEARVLECLDWLASRDQINSPLKLRTTYMIGLDKSSIAAVSKALSLYGITCVTLALKLSDRTICCFWTLLSNAASSHCLASSGNIESKLFSLHQHQEADKWIEKKNHQGHTMWRAAAWCQSVKCLPMRYLSSLTQPRPSLDKWKA